MNNALRHRGPDAAGEYCSGQVALGFRRLSIIDLSDQGNQPHFNETDDIISVVNGEIYNYLELKAQLQAKGHIFYSDSDTEVIPHLYEEYGADFLQHLNGMFAIILFDRKANRLLFARDRLGIKPLYYYFAHKTLLVASEIKAFKQVENTPLIVDRSFLPGYLYFQYLQGDTTPFLHVHKVLPGCYVEYTGEKPRTHQYWSVQLECVERSLEEYLDELHTSLDSSVGLQLQSDVPVGVFLSGGVDSSLIAYYANRRQNHSFRLFHIDMADDNPESHYARQMAQKLGLPLEEHRIDFDRIDQHLDTLLYHHDEPIGDSALISTFLICQKASEYASVLLTGLGGDELFGGYGRYLRGMHYPPEKLHRQVRFFSEEEIARLCPALHRGFDPACYMQSQLVAGNDHANQLMWLDCRTFLADQLLTMQDKMSMANSIEVRVPFLDHRLVEMVFRMPSRYKMPEQGKMILKRLLGKIMGHHYAYRQKKGFGVPLVHWLRENEKWIFDFIEHESGMVDFFQMDRAALHSLLRSATELRNNKIWILFVLARWLRCH